MDYFHHFLRTIPGVLDQIHELEKGDPNRFRTLLTGFWDLNFKLIPAWARVGRDFHYERRPHSSFWFLWETFWGVFLCQSAASLIYQKLAWACDKVVVKFFTCLKVSTIPPTRGVRWKINRKRFNLQKQCGVESIEIRRTNQFFVLVGDWNLFSYISLK